MESQNLVAQLSVLDLTEFTYLRFVQQVHTIQSHMFQCIIIYSQYYYVILLLEMQKAQLLYIISTSDDIIALKIARYFINHFNYQFLNNTVRAVAKRLDACATCRSFDSHSEQIFLSLQIVVPRKNSVLTQSKCILDVYL